MTYEQILYSIEDRILTITLNRPDRLNAFTLRMGEEILDALDQADADDRVRVVIFTGAGRAFCAGADLTDVGRAFNADSRANSEDRGEERDFGGLVALRLYELKKPVIAAINGSAVGVGITMTLPMDVRIASAAARIGFVFARRGLTPEACSTWFLPRVVGISRAAEWIYSGRLLSAEEALAGGLVSRLHAAEDLLPAARAIAREIADNTSAMSVTLSRQLLWRMLGSDHPMEAHKIESKCIYWMGRSADVFEGVSAFLEKRPPRFSLGVSEMPDFYPWWPTRRFRETSK